MTSPTVTWTRSHRVAVVATRDLNPPRTLVVCDCGWTVDVPEGNSSDSLAAAAQAYKDHATS